MWVEPCSLETETGGWEDSERLACIHTTYHDTTPSRPSGVSVWKHKWRESGVGGYDGISNYGMMKIIFRRTRVTGVDS